MPRTRAACAAPARARLRSRPPAACAGSAGRRAAAAAPPCGAAAGGTQVAACTRACMRTSCISWARPSAASIYGSECAASRAGTADRALSSVRRCTWPGPRRPAARGRRSPAYPAARCTRGRRGRGAPPCSMQPASGGPGRSVQSSPPNASQHRVRCRHRTGGPRPAAATDRPERRPVLQADVRVEADRDGHVAGGPGGAAAVRRCLRVPLPLLDLPLALGGEPVLRVGRLPGPEGGLAHLRRRQAGRELIRPMSSSHQGSQRARQEAMAQHAAGSCASRRAAARSWQFKAACNAVHARLCLISQ
jgi:hypothetical protein